MFALVAMTIVLAGVYLSSLWVTFNDLDRRSLSLEIPPASVDNLHVNIDLVKVDVLHLEMTARLSFRLAGKLAQDETTPAQDLTLVLNTINGPQDFVFKKGQRINPIEADFPLEGDSNLYPFDRYKGALWVFATVTEKGRAVLAPASQPGVNVVSKELAAAHDLPISTSVLERTTHADTAATFHASIPGLTFRGSQSIHSAQALKGLTGVKVNLQRSNYVLLISITTMLMMTGLSFGLVITVFTIVTGRQRVATFQIPMATSLIFGLPALRNIQPGIPPPGTFGDSIVFTWAEMIAAASAVTLIIRWLLQGDQPGDPPDR